MSHRFTLLGATGVAVGIALALLLSGSAGANYPNPTTGPDGSPMPADLSQQPLVLHVDDHGTWKILTIHPTLTVVNGKRVAEVTKADIIAAEAHAQIDPNQQPQPPAPGGPDGPGTYKPPGAP